MAQLVNLNALGQRIQSFEVFHSCRECHLVHIITTLVAFHKREEPIRDDALRRHVVTQLLEGILHLGHAIRDVARHRAKLLLQFRWDQLSFSNETVGRYVGHHLAQQLSPFEFHAGHIGFR